MKKLVSLVMALIMVLSLATVATAAETAPKYKIGILASAVTHGWVGAVAYNAKARCEELGVEYNITTAGSIEEMTAQIDDQLAWGAQALVVCAQWPGIEDSIADVVAKNIPVVNFDIDIAVDGVYKVTGNNYGMGVLSAKYIVEKIGTTGTVVALPVPTSGSVSELRMQGFYDTIKEIAPELVVKEYATAFTRDAGLADMADILIAEEHIDAVYSLDDETSIGALQAIGEAKRTDIKAITGGGGCQEYFNMMDDYADINVSSALYSPSMVIDAVDMAIALLNGETVDSPFVVPTAIVDKANVADYLDENTPY